MFIAMKLVDGQTLHQMIHQSNRNHTSIFEWEIFGQICQTMAYVHSRDFIHRDLNPKNVMIGAFGEVQITDWGVARKIGYAPPSPSSQDTTDNGVQQFAGSPVDSTQRASPGDTRHGDVIGTPAYMPPEQAKGELADKRSDVFAIGGILFEILIRKTPFDEPTATKAISKSIRSDLASAYRELEICNADSELIALAKECLDADPNKRPADAQHVNQRFNEFLERREQKLRTVELEKVRSEEQLAAQRKRNHLLVWSTMAIAGVLVLSMVAAVLYLSEKNARLEDQAKLKREQNDARLIRESQIIDSISKAKELQRFASEASQTNDDQRRLWTNALLELKKAEGIVNESINPKLRSEFDEAKKSIQQLAGLAAERVEQRKLEQASELEILACIDQFYLPDELERYFTNIPIIESLGSTYSNLGIEPGNDFQKIRDYVLQSPIKTTLLRALPIWQIKLAQSETPDQALIDWIGELEKRIDQDPFRTRIRAIIKDKNKADATRELAKEESTDSVLTVYLCSALKGIVDEPDFVQYLVKAQRKHPNDFTVNWNLAKSSDWLYSNLPRHRQTAIQHMLVCYSMQPKNIGVMMNLSSAYVLDGTYDSAIEVLEKIVEIVPEFPLVYSNLATCYASKGDYDKALIYCDKVLGMTENAPNALVLRATILRERKEFKQAEIDLELALKLAPDMTLAHERLGEVYERLGKIDSAIESTKIVVKAKPNHVPARQFLASLYVRAKQWALAETELNGVLEMTPRDPNSIVSLAYVYLNQDKQDEAAELLQEAIYDGINSHSLQLMLAKVYLATDLQEEAIPILENLVRLVPQMDEPKRILDKIRQDE